MLEVAMYTTRRDLRICLAAASLALASLPGCGDDTDESGDRDDSRSGATQAGTRDAGSARQDAAQRPPAAGSTADDGVVPVTIDFEAKVGSKEFACGESYSNVGTPGRQIRPVDLRFYVHDLRLISDSGEQAEVELEQDESWQYRNVALIDFEDGSGECNLGDTATHKQVAGKVAPGRYTGVAFKVGIPLELNHSDLSAQPAPLNKSSLFWSWNSGHLFFVATSRTVVPLDDDAGTADAGSDEHGDAGTHDADGGVDSINDHFTHVGSTGCEGNPTAGVPVERCLRPNRPEYTFADFDPQRNAIVVDFAEVKRGSDVAANPGCHASAAETCTAPFARLGIDFADGSPTPETQTVFRVE
jgi:uncharacterized repeat protein (TIGR04052 family)